jgi:hypothetical protein
MTRMNWRKAYLHGKPSLDYRFENDEDRAAKWLRRAEASRRREVSVPAKVQRRTMAIAEQLGGSSWWVTADSSAEVPW